MNAGSSRPDGWWPRRPGFVRVAWWCAAGGLLLGIAIVVCVAAGAIGANQAVALAVPAALLIIGGLIVAALPDTVTARQRGFRAGLLVGSLLRRWRAALRRYRSRNGL
jgi:hypothetical protein